MPFAPAIEASLHDLLASELPAGQSRKRNHGQRGDQQP
jgi:hypothetical protein